MAEDNSIASTETADVVAPVKKTRAPRQKKDVVAADAAANQVEAAKPADGLARKSKASSAKANVAPKAARAKPAPKAAPSVAVNADGFDDLIKLEKENTRLRKLLAEKLRGENADLRKKLGQA